MAVGDEISGSTGTFKYGATPTEFYITGFTFKRSTGQIDVTSSKQASTGYRKRIGNGFTDVEGTFEGFVQLGVNEPTFGTSMALELLSHTNRKWAGNGTITEITEVVDVPGDNAVTISGSFVGSGEFTKTDTTV